MDTSEIKGGIDRGKGIGGRGQCRSRIFKSNEINYINSTGSQQKEIKFSPQTQVKQLTSYANVRDAFINYIQNNFVQCGQDVTKGLKYITAIDLDAENPQQNISNNTYDRIKAIEYIGYYIK